MLALGRERTSYDEKGNPALKGNVPPEAAAPCRRTVLQPVELVEVVAVDVPDLVAGP